MSHSNFTTTRGNCYETSRHLLFLGIEQPGRHKGRPSEQYSDTAKSQGEAILADFQEQSDEWASQQECRSLEQHDESLAHTSPNPSFMAVACSRREDRRIRQIHASCEHAEPKQCQD